MSIKSKFLNAVVLREFRNKKLLGIKDVYPLVEGVYKGNDETRKVINRLVTGNFGHSTVSDNKRLFRQVPKTKEKKKQLGYTSETELFTLTKLGWTLLERGTADIYYDTILNTPRFREQLYR